MPWLVDVGLVKDIDIMVWPWVLNVQIYEQPTMVHHNYVVHVVHFFWPIKPIMIGWIILKFMDFVQGPINKSIVALELSKLCCQNLSFNIRPPNFVGDGKIDARCNKYAIINYCILTPISHEGIILNHIIIFHVQDETKQMLFWGQFGWSPKNVVCLPCEPHMTNNGWNHKLCQTFKLF
jgi:hypothetical protein